ncbi:hypothetical protein MPER_03831, partial [Moniliophthora perniciosa FA553]
AKGRHESQRGNNKIFLAFLSASSTRFPGVYSNGSVPGSNPSLGQNTSLAHGSVLPSVIRKKLLGYVGFSTLANQVHRKSVRKGFQFTAMVVGESGLGKSTLINTLFNTTLYPPKEHLPPSAERPKTVAIESIGACWRDTLIGDL